MRLYVLRHADAVESPYYTDADRPLSDLGRRQTHAVARFLLSHQIKPHLIMSSPFLRAKETADIVKESLAVEECITTHALASGAGLRECLKEINGHPLPSVLLIGHEPLLSGLISVLTGGDEQFRVDMGKATLACLESRHPAKKGHAVLLWLLPVSLAENLR